MRQFGQKRLLDALNVNVKGMALMITLETAHVPLQAERTLYHGTHLVWPKQTPLHVQPVVPRFGLIGHVRGLQTQDLVDPPHVFLRREGEHEKS